MYKLLQLTYTKPANLFIWLFVFGIFGPLIGLVQIITLFVILFGISGISIFPFGLIYSIYFLIPAMLTGLGVFKLKHSIKKYWQLFLFCLLGPLITFFWIMIAMRDLIRNNVLLLTLIFASYLSTVLLTWLFIYKEKA